MDFYSSIIQGKRMYSIMIVDDEMAIRENLPKALPFEKYGFYVCSTATNGVEALEKLPDIKPDLILLDVCMPIMDGLGFLEQLRNGEYKDTVVIMLSGYSEFEYAQKAVRFGVKAYLNKPIDEDEIFPLLEELHQQITIKEREIMRGTFREHANLLKKMYSGGQGNRKEFKKYDLMHCVVLSMASSFEDKIPYEVLQECLGSYLEEYNNCLISSRGSLYTYMLPKDLLKENPKERGIFAKHLIYILKNANLECVLLFDSYIFDKEERSFREDYSNHLYRMLTDVFFGARGFLEYNPVSYGLSYEKLNIEDHFLESLKRNLLELDRVTIEKEFMELAEEIRLTHLEIYLLQKISFRIYYLLIEIMSSINNTECDESILQPPESRDSLFFILFDKWKKIQMLQIMDAFSFIERSRKLSNLGVCGKVVDYVHRHYSEQINIKQVADIFFVNSTYLGRAFQKAMGVGFNQYVNDLRIAEAKRLLSQTNKLIYEIANQVGYTESKYFISKFTSEVGISPSNYRRG